MEGTIRELVVKRLDSKIRKLRTAKRRLAKRLLEDPKLDEAINQLVSIRRRLAMHISTGAKIASKPKPNGNNASRSRTRVETEKTKASI